MVLVGLGGRLQAKRHHIHHQTLWEMGKCILSWNMPIVETSIKYNKIYFKLFIVNPIIKIERKVLC